MSYKYQIITRDFKNDSEHVVATDMTLEEAIALLKLLLQRSEHCRTVDFIVREIVKN